MMKKLILAMVFVFATGTMMNANTNKTDLVESDCFQDAWDYGTEWGDGDEYDEWWYTNWYYENIYYKQLLTTKI